MLERVLAAQWLARSAMDEIREVIFGLASDGQIELPRALREVIEDVEAGTRLEVGLRVYGQTQPVPAATQHALVQIAREALFNVVRHAEAHHAWVDPALAAAGGVARRWPTTARVTTASSSTSCSSRSRMAITSG